MVANFTVNTDFADADVDTQQFNLTPYKLFFPEKRQFFLENAGVFNFSMGGDSGNGDLLFFSRQIGIDPITGIEVPVNGGAKVTGSLGNFELGAMEVNTRQLGPNPSANYAVMRVKRSLWGGSYVPRLQSRRLQFVTNILHSFVIGLTSKCNGRSEAFEHRLAAAGIHAAQQAR